MAISTQKQEALLAEYRACGELVTRLDNLIWQTASIFFPITLAGFAFFGTSSHHTIEQFFTTIATGIGSTTLLLAWYFLSRRWYVYEQVAFYRIREIEKELGFWHERYSSFARESTKRRKHAIQETKNDIEKRKFEQLDKKIGNMPIVGIKITTATITVVFIIGWIAIIIREYVLTF